MTSDLSEYFAFKNLNISQNKQISILICKQVKSYFKEEEGKSHTFGLIVSNKKNKYCHFNILSPDLYELFENWTFVFFRFVLFFYLNYLYQLVFFFCHIWRPEMTTVTHWIGKKILKMSEEKNQVICFTQICKLGSFLRLPVELQGLHFFIGGVPTFQSVFEENMRTNVHLPKAHSAVIKCVTYFIQWDD